MLVGVGWGRVQRMSKVYKFSAYIPYGHVDQMGFLYYANYYLYFEMARSALLREEGIPYAQLEAKGAMLPIVESHCNHSKPAHYDDCIDFYSRCSISGIKFRIDYEVKRGETLLATGYTVHVCMGQDGRPRRPVSELIELAAKTA